MNLIETNLLASVCVIFASLFKIITRTSFVLYISYGFVISTA